MQLSTATGVLVGTLTVPTGCGPRLVTLVVADSGATDRDGNRSPEVSTDGYKLLAQHLAEHGVASVRYDKRGVGESLTALQQESDLRVETHVDDVVAWLTELRGDPRFTSVLVIGHGEGALVGALALQGKDVLGFLSLAGAGRPVGEEMRDQLSKSLSGSMLQQGMHIVDELEGGREVVEVPSGTLSALFRPSIQPYLISLFSHDPAAELKGVTAPTLVAAGSTDTELGVSDVELLLAARPGATPLRVEGMCHVLKLAALEPAAQLQAYTDPTQPLAPPLLDGIDRFIASTLPH